MDIHETTAQAERLVVLVRGYVAGWRWAYTVACNYLGDNPDNPFSECWKNWPEFRQPVLAYAASTLVGQTTNLSPEECLERNPWGAVLGAIRREFIPIEPELARFGWPPSVPLADFWDTPQVALIERMIADGYCDEEGVDWSKSQVVGFAIVAEMEKELALLRKCVDGLRREAIRARSSEHSVRAANPTTTIPSETVPYLTEVDAAILGELLRLSPILADQTTLAVNINIDRSTIGPRLSKLIGDGHVCQPETKRSGYGLTAKGRETASKLPPH